MPNMMFKSLISRSRKTSKTYANNGCFTYNFERCFCFILFFLQYSDDRSVGLRMFCLAVQTDVIIGIPDQILTKDYKDKWFSVD